MQWLNLIKDWLLTPFTDGPPHQTESEKREKTVRTRSFQKANDTARELGNVLTGKKTTEPSHE